MSRPWCEVAQAEIRTRNLPIANPALYHTATSAPRVRSLSVTNPLTDIQTVSSQLYYTSTDFATSGALVEECALPSAILIGCFTPVPVATIFGE